MAASLQYLQRVEITPNLDKTLNVGQGQDAQRSPCVWTYNATATGSNEAEATVAASNYFLFAYGFLTVGDIIFVIPNDTAGLLHIYCVTTCTSGGVTVTVTV